MVNRYADSQQNRMLQMQLQQGDQDFARMENALNRTLEQQALQLQQAGLDAESAWRESDRMLQSQLENRALDLQATGMTMDQAYRTAALNLDREQMSQAGQIANQQAQLSAADIYLRALAAGAASELPPGQTLAQPNVNLIGGGTTQNPDAGNLPPPPNNDPYQFPEPPNDPLLPLPQDGGGSGGDGSGGGGTPVAQAPLPASQTAPADSLPAGTMNPVTAYPAVDPNMMISVGGEQIPAWQYEQLYGPLV
jgi:hypothetical protein